VPGLGPGTVSLILGSDFNGLSGKGPGHKQSVSSLAKSYGGINGNANMCHDSAAWAP
jgi:hypothetical protein